MTKQIRITNDMKNSEVAGFGFRFRCSFDIRHSGFVMLDDDATLQRVN